LPFDRIRRKVSSGGGDLWGQRGTAPSKVLGGGDGAAYIYPLQNFRNIE